MSRLSQDAVIAIVLLLISGALMIASFDIREPDYGQLSPATWPRAVVAALGLLSLIYLVQSLRGTADRPAGGASAEKESTGESEKVDAPRAGAFFGYWRNVIWCFSLFLLYLLTMPFLGMLIGGVAFAFLLMNALGGWSPRQMALHGLIAVAAVGGMWALFTFGLKVPLPPGQILPRF